MRKVENISRSFLPYIALASLGLLLATSLGYLTAYTKYHANTVKAVPTDSTQVISGTLTDVIDGRPIDGHCYMIVNKRSIILEPTSFTSPPNNLDGPYGRLVVDGVTYDAKCKTVAAYVGSKVEVFARGDDTSTYLSIYGNSTYFVNVRI